MLVDLTISKIRNTLEDLLSDGTLVLVPLVDQTDQCEPAPDEGGDDAPGDGEGDDVSAVPGVDANSRAFNLALYRVADGKGSITRNLSILTGLSENSIKKRVMRTRYNYDESRDGEWTATLSPTESRLYEKLYRDSKDPAIQAWLTRDTPSCRAHPDCRSASRDAAQRSA